MMTLPIINGTLYIILFIYFRVVKYTVLPSQKKKVHSTNFIIAIITLFNFSKYFSLFFPSNIYIYIYISAFSSNKSVSEILFYQKNSKIKVRLSTFILVRHGGVS